MEAVMNDLGYALFTLFHIMKYLVLSTIVAVVLLRVKPFRRYVTRLLSE